MNDVVFNGIDAVTGAYDIPPLGPDVLVERIRRQPAPENLRELRYRHESRRLAHLGVKEGVDPKRLDESGWGIVFAQDADPAIKEALAPLLQHRESQAGERYRLYEGDDGYRSGESKSAFLARSPRKMGPGCADPEKVPYYLLICASPEKIPYRFQNQLDVQFAVGRIHFPTLADYAAYANSVVAAETGRVLRERRGTLFCVTNPADPSTHALRRRLMDPLREGSWARSRGWQFDFLEGRDARKQRLAELLTSSRAPTLLLASAHGVRFPYPEARAMTEQGALLCDDWPGPNDWSGPIPADFYFSARDLDPGADLTGLIAFLFASYGAGTPASDVQALADAGTTPHLTQGPFVAGLATRMLCQPSGGALAVAAPIGPMLGYSSLDWIGSIAQGAVFESAMLRLIDGHPIGSALEYLSERYAELATVYSDQIEEIEFGLRVDPSELVGLWAHLHDSGNFAVVGDPAVRLPIGAIMP
jgi:hypothetical protein